MQGTYPPLTVRYLMVLVVLVAACSAPPAAAPTPTPTPGPTETPYVPFGTGVITFGTSYDPDDLSIPTPKTSFKTSSKKIAWSASLLMPAGATSLTFILASKSASGVEQIIVKTEVDISNPDVDTIANDADLALLVGRKAGTYVMRYLRGNDLLAEGQFRLVK
jgi:hypothetical protein